MRAIVLALNIATVLLVLAIEPPALYLGAWSLLGDAYGHPEQKWLGLTIVAAPLLLALTGVIWSQRLLRRRHGASVAVAALPVLAGIAAILHFVPAIFPAHH
jgi:hypothetical protein